MISGNPVIVATSMTGIPAARSAFAVPPVETISYEALDEALRERHEPVLVGDAQQRAQPAPALGAAAAALFASIGARAALSGGAHRPWSL